MIFESLLGRTVAELSPCRRQTAASEREISIYRKHSRGFSLFLIWLKAGLRPSNSLAENKGRQHGQTQALPFFRALVGTDVAGETTHLGGGATILQS